MTMSEEVQEVQWFPREEAVFMCLSRMIADGWVPSNEYRGIVYGVHVVRPVKKAGERKFSGVALINVGEGNE